MFLLVTLEKEGLEEQFRYRDQFISPDIFQWQSQNRTTQSSIVGQAMKYHRERDVEVHLFVRRQPKLGGRAPLLSIVVSCSSLIGKEKGP